MVDISAIAGALSSIKIAGEMAGAMIELRDAETFQLKRFELQSKLLDAQDSVFAAQQERSALIEETEKLRRQISDVLEWGVEKQRYELRQVSSFGTYVYVRKRNTDDDGPPHCNCASCYQSNKKSILQGKPELATRRRVYACPMCKSEIVIESDKLRDAEAAGKS
jgi:hypothetical protein